MLEEIILTLCSVALFALVLVIPGIFVGSMSNAFSYRQQTILIKLALALLLSISICPILTYVIARFAGLPVVVLLYVVLFLVSLIWACRKRASTVDMGKQLFAALYAKFWIVLAILFWIVFCMVMLCDVQIDSTLLNSCLIYDHGKHIAVTDAICRTGIPPSNPYFYPGHALQLFYYYFWDMMAAPVTMILPGQIAHTKAVVIAGCVWIGLALMSTAVIFLHQFYPQDNKKNGYAWALALLPVSGLAGLTVFLADPVDFITFAVPSGSLYWCFYNLVFGWIESVLYAPQHVGSLIVCLVGTMLLAAPQTGKRTWSELIIAGLSFASALGMSVYVGLTFALFWMLYTLTSLFCRLRTRLPSLMVVAVVTAMFSFLFLHDLLAAKQTTEQVIALNISPVFAHTVIQILRSLISLLNGFGVVILCGCLYWQSKLDCKQDRFLLALFSVSLFVSCFLRSTIHNNDLGWRSILVAQFILLIWSARYLVRRRELNEGALKVVLVNSLIVLGLITSIYDCCLMRIYPLDNEDGHMVYQLRAAYQILNKILIPQATIQHNPGKPDFMDIEPFFALYGHHQVIASDGHVGPLFGVDKRAYNIVAGEVGSIFFNAQSKDVDLICQRYKIDCLLVKNSDRIWRTPNSWVYSKTPAITNNYLKAFIINRAAMKQLNDQ